MRDIKIAFPPSAAYVYGKLKEAGYEVYLVGGSVRDALLGNPVHDYDLTTSASPDEMRAVFVSDHLIPTGEKHGTMTVRKYGENIEVTTYRTEGKYTDHRHPSEVEYTKNIAKDLARRDFTINAMAYDPQYGIVDLFGGQKDLENGILRCVGNPDMRFEEDALRILRGLRFISRFGFHAEESTKESMHGKKGLLQYLSGERVWNELTGLLEGSYAAETVNDYKDIVQTVLSEWNGLKADFSGLRKNAEVRLAFLLKNAGTSDVRNACARLKVSGRTKKHILNLHALWNRENLTDVPGIRFLRIRYTDEELYDAVSGLEGEHEDLKKELDRCISLQRIRSIHELQINGNDLLEMGIPSAKIGRELENLLKSVLKEELKNEKSVLADAVMRGLD